jgi:hypothetical protein
MIDEVGGVDEGDDPGRTVHFQFLDDFLDDFLGDSCNSRNRLYVFPLTGCRQ